MIAQRESTSRAIGYLRVSTERQANEGVSMDAQRHRIKAHCEAHGLQLARQQMTEALRKVVRDRLSDSTLDKVVRNAASSWTQSGHLKGRGRKVRQRVAPTAVTTAFALLLGYLAGMRGQANFETLWAMVLDTPAGELMQLASDARRLGFLDMTQSGGVIEISFARLLAVGDRRFHFANHVF